MSGVEFVGTVTVLGIVFLISTIGSKAMHHKTERVRAESEMERKKLENETLITLQKNMADALGAALEAQQSFYRTMLRQDFDKLSINGESFTHEELRKIVRMEKTETFQNDKNLLWEV